MIRSPTRPGPAVHHRLQHRRRPLHARVQRRGDRLPSGCAQLERYRRHGRNAAVLPDIARARALDRSNAGSTASIAASTNCCARAKTLARGRRHFARRTIRLRRNGLRFRCAKARRCCAPARKPGDAIYVSGPLGGWRNKRVIVPRLEFGRKLVGKATACMDISDGLALDLHRLCMASGVAAELDTVPLLNGATIDQALHDGEDYELLYTAPPRTTASRAFASAPSRKASPARCAIRRQAARSPSAMTTPNNVLDLIDAFRRSKTMFAAVKLGIFDGSAPGGLQGTTALARRLRRARAARKAAMAPTSTRRSADKYLRSDSPDSFTGYIRYSNDALYPMWAHLEDAVREGTPRWKQTFGIGRRHLFRLLPNRRRQARVPEGHARLRTPQFARSRRGVRSQPLSSPGGSGRRERPSGRSRARTLSAASDAQCSICPRWPRSIPAPSPATSSRIHCPQADLYSARAASCTIGRTKRFTAAARQDLRRASAKAAAC